MEDFRGKVCGDYVVTSARSAGPLYIQALETAPQLHKHVWEKGVIWRDGEEAAYTNPTMSARCAVRSSLWNRARVTLTSRPSLC